MKWLNWILGKDNTEAERLQANVGKLADTFGELNDKIRENAGFSEPVKIIGPNRIKTLNGTAKHKVK